MTERHVDKLRRSRDHIQRMLDDPESTMGASVRAELELGLAAIVSAIDREVDGGQRVSGQYGSRREAIVAALDELEEGATLVVHSERCRIATTGACTCQPETWTY